MKMLSHTANNEPWKEGKLQNRTVWTDTNFIESFNCHLRVTRCRVKVKSKRAIANSRQDEAMELASNDLVWHVLRRPSHKLLFLTGSIDYFLREHRPATISFTDVPQRRVLSGVSKTKSSGRHQSLQHLDRILEPMTSEYETKWSQSFLPFILRLENASLASRYHNLGDVQFVDFLWVKNIETPSDNSHFWKGLASALNFQVWDFLLLHSLAHNIGSNIFFYL